MTAHKVEPRTVYVNAKTGGEVLVMDVDCRYVYVVDNFTGTGRRRILASAFHDNPHRITGYCLKTARRAQP